MFWYIKCLKQYADFSGRARRKEYWMFVLFYYIILNVIGLIEVVSGLTEGYEIGPLVGLYMLGMLIPSLAVIVRRLHDLGKSGWLFFLIFVPIFGIIVLFVWFCTEGDRKENKWGPDPKECETQIQVRVP